MVFKTRLGLAVTENLKKIASTTSIFHKQLKSARAYTLQLKLKLLLLLKLILYILQIIKSAGNLFWSHWSIVFKLLRCRGAERIFYLCKLSKLQVLHKQHKVAPSIFTGCPCTNRKFILITVPNSRKLNYKERIQKLPQIYSYNMGWNGLSFFITTLWFIKGKLSQPMLYLYNLGILEENLTQSIRIAHFF